MGNWSPYSKEWERQHLQKIIDGAETARIEFEKKPWIYKAIVVCFLTMNIGRRCSRQQKVWKKRY